MPRTSHIPRREGLLLAALLVLGFGFRAWDLENAGVDHFDEGVYVFSALGLSDPSQPHRLYPRQVRFSPPVFFGLVALASSVLGLAPDRAAILLNVVLGTLTIASVWWIGRAWFGAPAGVAAAALLSFNEFHVALSRTALTDVAFALAFLWALAAIAAALQRQSTVLAVLAGLAVGLAWNTKYHGWFALIIAAGGWLCLTWRSRESTAARVRALRLWAIMAAVAAASFLPWALFIHSQPGGYADLAAYQRTLLSPYWFRNLWQQAQMQLFMEGPLSRASIPLALLFTLLLGGRRSHSTSTFGLLLLLFSAAALALGGSGATALLVLLVLPMLVRKPATTSWLLLSWLVFWVVVTPLYHPYARLVLPATLAMCLAAGAWLARLVEGREVRTAGASWQPALAAVGALAVLGVAAAMPDPSNPWRPSRSLPEVASRMQDLIPPGSRVLAIGEPSLAFYLHLGNRPAFDRVDNVGGLDSLRIPLYIVTGVYAKRAPRLREKLERLRDQLAPLGTFSMSPKDVRLLDDFTPPNASRFRARPDRTYDLTLFHFSPKARPALVPEEVRGQGVGPRRGLSGQG
jgi:hypothetical protein